MGPHHLLSNHTMSFLLAIPLRARGGLLVSTF